MRRHPTRSKPTAPRGRCRLAAMAVPGAASATVFFVLRVEPGFAAATGLAVLTAEPASATVLPVLMAESGPAAVTRPAPNPIGRLQARTRIYSNRSPLLGQSSL